MVIKKKLNNFIYNKCEESTITEIIMEKFGSFRTKTIHAEKVKLDDGFHFRCYHKCPHNVKGICKCIIIDNSIHVKYCFCG